MFHSSGSHRKDFSLPFHPEGGPGVGRVGRFRGIDRPARETPLRSGCLDGGHPAGYGWAVALVASWREELMIPGGRITVCDTIRRREVDLQTDGLSRPGCERLFTDKVGGMHADRRRGTRRIEEHPILVGVSPTVLVKQRTRVTIMQGAGAVQFVVKLTINSSLFC